MLIKVKCDYCESEDLELVTRVVGRNNEGERTEECLKCCNCDEELDWHEVIFEEAANSTDNAIKLLQEQGYVVTKLTKAMEQDAKACEECDYEGDCMSCACSICIVQ